MNGPMQKAWATLQARAAMHGFELHRVDVAGGAVRLFLSYDNQVRELTGIDELEALAMHVAALPSL